MYVVAKHDIRDPETAFPRGEKLIRGEGAPDEARVLQFYPSQDASAVSCLWEAGSAGQVQAYVDKVLGDASDNVCYEVDAARAFAAMPTGLPAPPADGPGADGAAPDGLRLVQQAYAAIGDGEIPRLLEMMSEDVEIRLPGPEEIPFAGTYRGREGAGRFFLTLAESAEVERFEPTAFVAHGGQVVALGHERLTAKPTGRTWATDWAMVWSVENSQITSLREFHQTAAIAAAFAPETVGAPSGR